MAERLPLTLRSYRQLIRIATPLAPFVLAGRLRRGKEHPGRIGERRGETQAKRPSGALIWAHGASVGEMLALTPLLEHVRGKGFNVLLTSGTGALAKPHW